MKTRIVDRGAAEFKLNEKGFLVTKAKLARTGILEYDGSEIGKTPGKPYTVEVTEEELFSPETMQSFEGATLTVLHPEGLEVNSKNWKEVGAGHTQNVRREGDVLVATGYIKDEAAIQKILDYGMKEVSIGHDALLIPSEKADFKKTHIVGDHSSIVPSGRAGYICRLGDKETIVSKSRKTLADALKKLVGIKLGDEAMSEEDKKAIEEAIAGLQAALAALPPEAAPEEVDALKAQIAELEKKLASQTVGDEGGDVDKDAIIAELKAENEALKTENADLKKRLDEVNTLNDKKSALADAATRFPNVKIGDAKTGRDVFEAVLVDAGVFTADEAKGKDVGEIKAAYAGLSAVKAQVKPTIGKKLLGDAKKEIKTDMKKRYGGANV